MKKKLLFIFLSVLTIVACNKSEYSALSDKEESSYVDSDEIVFTTETVTKAVTPVTTANLTQFNVLCVTGTLGSSESSVFNVSFSGSSGNLYKGGQYWPKNTPSAATDKYKFYACNIAMTSNASGPTISAPDNTTDVVCAVCTSPTYNSTNALTFNHIFAQLGTVKVTAPSGYNVSNLTLKITPKVAGTYNLYSGNGKTDGTGWSSTSGSTAVTISKGSSSSPTSSGTISGGSSVITPSTGKYVVPGSYKLSATYTITKGAYSETFTNIETSTAKAITAGKVNNLEVSLKGGSATEIEFSVSVTEWSDQTVSYSF